MSQQDALRKLWLDTAGESGRYALDGEITPLWIDLMSGTLLDLLTQMNGVNGTRHFIKASDVRDSWYAYTTRNRQYKLGGAGSATLNAGTNHVTGVDGWRVSADTVINEQRATVDAMTFPLPTIKVWEFGSTIAGSTPSGLPFTVTPTTPFKTNAKYADYVPSCPTLVYTYTGTQPTVTVLNEGWSADITIASTGSTSITGLYMTGVETVREPSALYQKDDTASQAVATRGIRAGPELTGDLLGSMPSAIGISQHIVWRYGQPLKRPTVTIANWIPTMFTLDIADVIAFTSSELQVTGEKFDIVGVTETVDWASASGVLYIHQLTLQQQPAIPAGGFFVLDSSLLDGSAVLAY